MEILDQLTAWLRRNVWSFVVATILTIFWMAAFWYVGQGAAIATWLSIILAVVVIIYTFFETYRSGQGLSEMRELVREGQDILAIKADELKTEAKSLKERQEEFARLFSDLQKGPLLTNKIDLSKEPQFRLNITACKWFQLFALYCIAKSFKSKHPLDLDALISAMYQQPDLRQGTSAHTAALWQLYGVFLGIGCFMESDSISLSQNSLTVKKFPNDAADFISESVQQQLDDPDMTADNRVHFKSIIEGIDHVAASPPATE